MRNVTRSLSSEREDMTHALFEENGKQEQESMPKTLLPPRTASRALLVVACLGVGGGGLSNTQQSRAPSKEPPPIFALCASVRNYSPFDSSFPETDDAVCA